LGVGHKADGVAVKEKYVAKSKEVKSKWSNSRFYRHILQSFYGRLWLKKDCFASDEDDGEVANLYCS
jgi:dihydroorotase-like cyclic amidohydrolase